MLNRKNKCSIIGLVLIILFVVMGLGLAKLKLDSFSKMILPSLSVKVGENTYYVDTKEEVLYKAGNNGKPNVRLTKDRIDKLGIILFDQKLYFINKDNMKFCSIDLDGNNIREIDECNIIISYQPIFKLGEHIYYYNSKNKLTRVDKTGKLEKIEAVANKFRRI